MQQETKGVKYGIFAFHFILGLSGVILIATGVTILWLISNYYYFVTMKILAPPMTIVATGGVVFVVTFLGYHVTIKQSYDLLTPFTIALVLVCVIELSVGITVMVLKGDYETSVKISMNKSMIDYQPDKYGKKQPENEAWNRVQRAIVCCGIDSPIDWVNASTVRGATDSAVPNTCCPKYGFAKSCSVSETSGDYKPVDEGCWKTFSCRIKLAESLLIGVGFGFSIIEIVGIVFACYLMASLKKRNRGAKR